MKHIQSSAVAAATALSLSAACVAQATSLVVGPTASIRIMAPAAYGTVPGVSMTSVPDQNGDGSDDLLLGSYQDRFWLLLDGQSLTTLARAQDLTARSLGMAVSSLSDIDFDGIDDFAVSGNQFVNVYSLAGQQMKVTPTAPQVTDFGRSVARIGDLTGDGIDELAIGDPECLGVLPTAVRAGLVQIVDLNSPTPLPGQRWATIAVLRGMPGDNFGNSIAGLGDIDGDGVPDFAVGSRQDGTPGASGMVQVFSGASVVGVPVVLTTLIGRAVGDQFGWSLARVGDLDNDGTPDLAIGARTSGSQSTSYVRTFSALQLAGVGGPVQPLFTTNGAIQASRPFFGYSISSAGDYNQDGVPDLLVGSPELSSGPPPSPGGGAAIVSGANGTYLAILSARVVADSFGSAVCELRRNARAVFDRGTGMLHLY